MEKGLLKTAERLSGVLVFIGWAIFVISVSGGLLYYVTMNKPYFIILGIITGLVPALTFHFMSVVIRLLLKMIKQ